VFSFTLDVVKTRTDEEDNARCTSCCARHNTTQADNARIATHKDHRYTPQKHTNIRSATCESCSDTTQKHNVRSVTREADVNSGTHKRRPMHSTRQSTQQHQCHMIGSFPSAEISNKLLLHWQLMATCFSRHCVIKYAFQMLTVAASEMCDVCITKYCT